HNFGPYPYTLSRNSEKVVDETDNVDLLAPENPLLSWPNKITEKDFDGWVEERGHSFMREWAPEYQALTEVHDPGQAPQKGGLLYARYGRGAYVYVAYALYRQLQEGVPGAYRLFANLLSLPQAQQVSEQAVRAGDAFLQLAVERIGHIHICAAAIARVEQAAFLRGLSGIMHLSERLVLGRPLAHE